METTRVSYLSVMVLNAVQDRMIALHIIRTFLVAASN